MKKNHINHINLNLTPVVEIIIQVCMYVWLNFGWLFEFLTHGCCEATSVREFLWLLECGGCGAVKQWKMTSLLCAHCLAANRAFQNRKSGYSTSNINMLYKFNINIRIIIIYKYLNFSNLTHLHVNRPLIG